MAYLLLASTCLGAGSAEPCGVYLVFCLPRGLKYALVHRSVFECVSDSALRDVSRVIEPLFCLLL